MYLYYVTSNYNEQVRNLYRVTVFETFVYIIIFQNILTISKNALIFNIECSFVKL